MEIAIKTLEQKQTKVWTNEAMQNC